MCSVLKARDGAFRRQSEVTAEPGHELFGRVDRRWARRHFAVDQIRFQPQGVPVAAPEGRKPPPRQRFARIPFSLSEVQQSAGGKSRRKPPDQIFGVASLGWADRLICPFANITRTRGNEGRLATHGQAHVRTLKLAIHMIAECEDRLPLLIAVGLCDAGRLCNARDAHVEVEADFGLLVRT